MNDEGVFPKAVCISDLHFSIHSLDLASRALKQALDKSEELEVPLIIAGDLNDTKALIRGEVANRLIEILSYSDNPNNIKILIGNHDLLNEKGDEHSLNFLAPYAEIIKSPVYDDKLETWLIPYRNTPNKLRAALAGITKGSTIIMHQGVMGADMGHYIKDSTSLSREVFADFRVISGHYHKAQDIKCGRPRKGAVGLFSYIGSPYTVSFAEANDGPKGFKILMSDGILEPVPTNLRKHIILERSVLEALKPVPEYQSGDLVWLKLTGPLSALAESKKTYIGEKLFGHCNFKLDKITLESEAPKEQMKEAKEEDLLDGIINRTPESESQKKILKALWRELLEVN